MSKFNKTVKDAEDFLSKNPKPILSSVLDQESHEFFEALCEGVRDLDFVNLVDASQDYLQSLYNIFNNAFNEQIDTIEFDSDGNPIFKFKL